MPGLKTRILIVEDDKELLEAIGGTFERDFDVQLANDGAQAWGKFFTFNPTIVITDVVMPIMDGAKLTRKIKGESPTTVVFAISGASEIYLSQAKIAGADAVFEKPNGMKSLLSKVQTFQLGIES